MKLPRKSKSTEPPPPPPPMAPPSGDPPSEPPKRRGRPRKQRRKEKETVTVELKKPIVLIGRYVLKEFSERVDQIGKVLSYKIGLYRVDYENGDFEDLDSSAIRRILIEDCDFDDDLIRRKNELDQSLLNKIIEESSELNVEDQEESQDVMDDDSRDSCSDAETPVELPVALELPPPLELPPSSGTIGVPEKYVSYLFSVYGFLRSFSIRLFLYPFSLDDFVGALNCRVPNTLLDAVHNSLMRALRRHLEHLAFEGSKIASRCLRCSEWSLLDTLTWPVFLIEYLAVNGYIKGSEWKGFYDEIFNGDYYSLPASRKLVILQILCEDVLESEELKAEMNMREESEVGKNSDVEDSPPVKNGLKRVHRRYAKTTDFQDEEPTKFVSKLDAVNLSANSEDEVDKNGDECRLCSMDGTLLCCDGCPAAYHSRCIGVMKMYIPEGPWHCPECKINMIGPTIARGTSLKGAEIFGNDLYGQLFLGTCDHLLVLNFNSSEFCHKYYNQNDIHKVIQVLYASVQHRQVYSGICMAMLQYWNIPESSSHLCVPNGTHLSSSSKIDENDHKGYTLGKAEYGPDFVVSTINHQSDMSCSNPDNKSTASISSKCSLVSNQFINYGNANDTSLPLQTNGDQTGFGKCKGNITSNFVYMGCSYKPQSYINNYMHGDFSASAAANLAIVSSEDSRSEGHVFDLKKATPDNPNLVAKAFSLTASRFFWPNSDKKLGEVIRERCSWCLSCKAIVSSKKGCMLNHAAIYAIKSAAKILSGLAPVRSGEGISPSISTYVIYLEESLHGLVDGPFLSENYRKLWRKQMERATSFSNIKPLLLIFEENIRTIAFCGDWVKLTDGWLVESLTIHSDTSTLGTTQERASCDRCRKQLPIKYTVNKCRENFGWWNGKFTKSVFQKAALPKFVVRKAARQGGLRKILGIVYPDVSEIPKRSRQLVWRASVEMSRNASQLALQVRYLDFYIRWIDLIRPEYNLQDGKGQDTEVSAFRNANIYDKKFAKGKTSYAIAFGSQKHISSRVRKIAEIEEVPEGEKLWFSETRIPLYLVKEYEVRNKKEPSHKDNLNIASQWHKRQLNAIWKDIFSYLTCKRDNLDLLSCSVCKQCVSFRSALKCSVCKGHCHEGCSIDSTFSTYTDVEFLTICKQCYHARLPTQKETINKSPNSTVLLKGRSLTILKEPVPKFDDEIPRSTRENDCRPDMEKVASHSPLETKSSCRISPLETKSSGKKSSWGIIWKKNNNENTGIDFRLKKVLLKRRSSLPQLEPVCHLCHKPYRSDLMYIGCESCTRWYHAEALELEESKIFSVLGFKCCRCRKIKSPVCPYSDLVRKEHVVEQSGSRASKRKRSGADSSSETVADLRACEPASPVFPSEAVSKEENNPFPFSLSNVELITKPKLELNAEKSHSQASKKNHSGEGSGSGTLADTRASEFTTPIFPAEDVFKPENNPLPFSLSDIELITDPKLKLDAGKSHSQASKKNHSGADSGPLADTRVSEPATPIFPTKDVSKTENNPPPFSLSDVELITEPELDAGFERNTISGSGLQKIQTTRHFKPEGDNNSSFGGEVWHAEISTRDEMGNLPAEVLSPFIEQDFVFADCNLLSDFDIVDNEYMDFESETHFSSSEFLHLDSSSHFEEADTFGDLSGFVKNSCTLGVLEECATTSLQNNQSPTISSNGNVHNCWQCSQTEPAPDLSCQICRMWIHSNCSPWIESSSRLGDWKCGNCREWQ